MSECVRFSAEESAMLALDLEWSCLLVDEDVRHTEDSHSVIAVTFSGQNKTSPSTARAKERDDSGGPCGEERKARECGIVRTHKSSEHGRRQIELRPEIRGGTCQDADDPWERK